ERDIGTIRVQVAEHVIERAIFQHHMHDVRDASQSVRQVACPRQCGRSPRVTWRLRLRDDGRMNGSPPAAAHISATVECSPLGASDRPWKTMSSGITASVAIIRNL